MDIAALATFSMADLRAVVRQTLEEPKPDVHFLLELASEYRRRKLFATEDTLLRIAARASDAELPWLLD